LQAEKVRWYPLVTYSPFLRTGARLKEIVKSRNVGFCGNVYLGLVRESEFFKDEVLAGLTERICDQKLQSLNKSVWSLMTEEIEKLPRRVRSHYGLYHSRRSFWDYYIFVVWYAANTLVRLGILNKVDREVSLFGLFADPTSLNVLKDYPNLKYEGQAHHFNDLPEVYASTKINICISNGLVYNGIPSKLIDCLASGGFALCDPKEDLVRFFGSVVTRIFFRDAEELNSKIEYYLAHPVEREEIVMELGLKIRQHCTLEALMRQVIECAKP
jgi:Glycosyl transferases group 1